MQHSFAPWKNGRFSHGGQLIRLVVHKTFFSIIFVFVFVVHQRSNIDISIILMPNFWLDSVSDLFSIDNVCGPKLCNGGQVGRSLGLAGGICQLVYHDINITFSSRACLEGIYLIVMIGVLNYKISFKYIIPS